MKRIFCLLLVMASIFAASAENLEFMGIPITGSISAFQEQLMAKGCSPTGENSEMGRVDARIFKGSFEGKECKIIVWYNNTSQQVYQVRVIINATTLEDIKLDFTHFKNLLTKKYEGTGLCYSDGTNSLVPVSELVNMPETYDLDLRITNKDFSGYIGSIVMQIVDYETMQNEWGLFINFKDAESAQKNEQSAK